MTVAIWFASAFLIFAFAMHLSSLATVALRSLRATAPPASGNTPAVTVLRPVCGLDHAVEATLRTTFEIEWPDYEIIFCCASATDPVVPIVEKLIAEHPRLPARLLTGDDRISSNPKLNNLAKGWQAAEHDWIVMADSNILLPSNYIATLLTRWTDGTGLVCSPPVGGYPHGFAAELECAFLNTYQARWQIAADYVGLGFAQGKTMLWRRDLLDRAGGIRALAAESAEDAAATKIVRRAGLNVRLVPAPFVQPLGRRDLRSVWDRQVRWARLRRASFKDFFAAELLSGGFFPLLSAVFLAGAGALSFPALLVLVAAWYGAEAILARLAGWHRSPLSFPASLLRDVLILPLWIAAWSGNDFTWRGNAVRIDTDRPETAHTNFLGKIGNIIRRGQPSSPPRAPAAGLARRWRTKAGRGDA